MLGQTAIGNLPRQIAPSARKVWRRLQPRSVLGLVLFGFALVCAPLIIGLVISGNQIAQLTRDSERLLEQAVGSSRAARGAAERALAVERAARQFRVLRDQSAEASLIEHKNSFEQQTRAIVALDGLGEAGKSASRLIATNQRLVEQALSDASAEQWPATLAAGFGEFNAQVRSLVSLSEANAERAVEALRMMGDRSRSVVNAQMAATIPIALVLAIVFIVLITRPIRDLEAGIRALTSPGQTRIPKSPGPRDLQALSVHLEWVRRRLLRTERDRHRLMAQVSHELKTPLSAIREGVGLLEEELLGPLDSRQAEVVAIIHDSAVRLQQQIETLLKYNKIRARPDPPAYRTVMVAALVDEVLMGHSLAITARRIAVRTEVADGLSIIGDIDMLRTALDNLASNAVKFTAPGNKLGIFAAATSDATVIEVADCGPGIAPSDRVRVFEAFYRGAVSKQGHQPGSGLGLTICRELIRAHGGDVRMVERPGWRTVFQITLPHGQHGETPDEQP
jgi:two-component system sensor histidine kinase GlrK